MTLLSLIKREAGRFSSRPSRSSRGNSPGRRRRRGNCRGFQADPISACVVPVILSGVCASCRAGSDSPITLVWYTRDATRTWTAAEVSGT